jgi:hypothetical protein
MDAIINNLTNLELNDNKLKSDDIKIKLPIEINDFPSIIQKALDTINIDTKCLTEEIKDICIKNELDIITKGIANSWAPLKATIVSVVAKIKYPEWDTRKHQFQLGGLYSLRTIDKRYVCNYLYKNDLYDTATEFALTRSFEKAEIYNKSYSGKISPKECKTAFLNIVELINTETNKLLLNNILAYLLLFLKNRKEKITNLKNSIVIPTKDVDLLDISNVCEFINKLNTGSSVVPVIAAHTLLSVIQPYLLSNISIKPLKEHTASDNHSKSYGDIEGFNHDSKPKIAIEVKHKIAIDASIVMIFDKKTIKENIPLKFIITTENIIRKIDINNICIDTLKNFITSYIQQALFHEKTICLIFIKELRNRIIAYTNLGIDIKENINQYITKLLV